MKIPAYRAAAILAMSLGSGVPAYAQMLPASGVFFYSSACYSADSGDDGGGTFKLRRTASSDTLEIGGAWEGPMAYYEATNVRLVPSRSKMFSTITYAFKLPWEATAQTYSGTVSLTAMRIKGLDGKVSTTPRRNEKAKLKACR
jgi:hypothetical protein